MNTTPTTFDPSLSMNDLPVPEAARIRALMAACKWLDAQYSPTKHFAEAAKSVTAAVAGLVLPDGAACVASRPVSARSMERYYYSWKNGKQDKAGRTITAPRVWQCFLDSRLCAVNRKQAATANRRFRAHLAALYARHKAAAISAVHELYAQWDNGETIPGYEGMNYRRNLPRPKGWSVDNLVRKMPKARALKIVREGIRAAYNELPQFRATRKGGWPCCEVMFDDVWLDLEATGYDAAGKLQIGRPLQLGALDAFTGRRLCWGTKLRTDRVDGTSVGLNADEMLFVLCDYLANVGYSRRGTVLVMEHGTAHITAELKQKLRDMTGGLVTVEEGSIQGKVQPGSIYGGRGAGNPRRKAMLEEWHGLQRNRLDGILTYTGHDRKEPEALHGIREAVKKQLKNAALLPAEQRELLVEIAPSLADVTNMLAHVVGALNNRTDHALTDWAACGFTALEFSADGCTNWTRIDTMKPAAREAVLAVVKADPSLLRQRNMSPQEAWEVSLADPANELIRFTPAQIVELLVAHKAEKLPAIKGGYFRINNRRVYHEELIYEACVKTAQGFERELPPGLPYYYIFNPLSADVYVLDEKGVVLGSAILSQRVPLVDEAAKLRQLGRVKHRLSERLEQARVIVAGDRARQEITAAHNAAVLRGEGLDALDRLDTAHLRRVSGKPAARKPLPDLLPDDEFDGLGLASSSESPATFKL